jgi:hypothetical protein
MNTGCSGQLADISPTRLQAAARGNPFAIFETDSWKLLPAHAQQQNPSGTDDNAMPAELPCDASLRGAAAAKGNPFVQSAPSHSLGRSSADVRYQSSNARQRRQEASAIHWRNCPEEVAASKQQRQKQKKNKNGINCCIWRQNFGCFVSCSLAAAYLGSAFRSSACFIALEAAAASECAASINPSFTV